MCVCVYTAHQVHLQDFLLPRPAFAILSKVNLDRENDILRESSVIIVKVLEVNDVVHWWHKIYLTKSNDTTL